MPASPLKVSFRSTLRWLRLRGLGLAVVFGCAMVGFALGADVSDRPGIPEAGLTAQIYYAVGLFVLGGLDLGVPNEGPMIARVLLWFAYFAAPLITASALVEGLLRAINPQSWRLRRLRDHIVIAGGGKLGMLYLAQLRQRGCTAPVVMVEARPDRETEDEARDAYRADFLTGDIRSPAVLEYVRSRRARRVMLLTGDDIANLDAAASILATSPEQADQVVVHVGDLRMMHVVEETKVAQQCRTFNTHRVAAQHLVGRKLIDRFAATERRDTVVLAGFGRFGQTVLDELQKRAAGRFDRVIIIDVDAVERARTFDEEQGFQGDFERHVVQADFGETATWLDLDAAVQGRDISFVIGSGDDGLNLRTALWLSKKYPGAYVVARSFRHSTFAKDVSDERGIVAFSVSDLLVESMPDEWFE